MSVYRHDSRAGHRHSDTAKRYHDYIRYHHRRVHRHSLHGRFLTWYFTGYSVHYHHLHLVPAQSRSGTPGRAQISNKRWLVEQGLERADTGFHSISGIYLGWFSVTEAAAAGAFAALVIGLALRRSPEEFSYRSLIQKDLSHDFLIITGALVFGYFCRLPVFPKI